MLHHHKTEPQKTTISRARLHDWVLLFFLSVPILPLLGHNLKLGHSNFHPHSLSNSLSTSYPDSWCYMTQAIHSIVKYKLNNDAQEIMNWTPG